ncbi:MAG: nucleotide pyrophosphohydrolase [Gammaproteobacteria bacterium]|nr:nucleotide pyrophosphohydrolase [Gammaproteobacteria bacterium]MDP2140913.1 nucleotide pyrophosphohydrolase [Gammaproteobacteria bacterium]MDP2349343.1 nucleotide pyrophosphohydrolase [Gammaproteobacteria bacterium]
MTDLEQIRQCVDDFAAERDWDQFHSPKNLAMALAVEVAELMEIFQWLSEEQSKALTPEQSAAVAHEIADIQVYLVRLADKLDIDIRSAVSAKMCINAEKYPADIVRGSARKYSDY